LIAVDPARLSWFDRRELDFDRIDVTASVTPSKGSPVWTYTASNATLRRYEEGRRVDRTYVSRAYVTKVRGAFAARGESAVRQYEASTAPPSCPLRDLLLIRAEGAAGI